LQYQQTAEASESRPS